MFAALLEAGMSLMTVDWVKPEALASPSAVVLMMSVMAINVAQFAKRTLLIVVIDGLRRGISLPGQMLTKLLIVFVLPALAVKRATGGPSLSRREPLLR